MEELVNSIPWDGCVDAVELGNHTVAHNQWTGVASEIVDEEGMTEGTLVYFPSVTIQELGSVTPTTFH